MEDKDYNRMVEILAKEFSFVVLVSADMHRGADVHELKKLFSEYTSAKAEIDIPSGLALAREKAACKDALLVICGSFYLAGSKYVQNT